VNEIYLFSGDGNNPHPITSECLAVSFAHNGEYTKK